MFLPIVKMLGPGMGLDKMVDQVIDYCGSRLLWNELLAEVKQENPRQYTQFEPWLYGPAPPPPTPPVPPETEKKDKVPTPPIPRRAWGLLTLLILDLGLIILWGWCLFGDQPNLMTYLQTAFTILGVPLAILAIAFALRRPILLEDALCHLGAERKWLYAVPGLTVLIVIVTCLFWPLGWVGNCVPTPPPPTTTATEVLLFSEDFSGETIDETRWDTSRLKYYDLKDGRLSFQTPDDGTAKSGKYYLNAIVPGDTISRIVYTFNVDPPSDSHPGRLGLETLCGPNNGYMVLLAGPKEKKPHAAYTLERGKEQALPGEILADGESHTVDVRWVENSVQVYVDKVLQFQTAACGGSTRYAHFGIVLLSAEARVSGYFDDISIWVRR
ncbi:MAG: hypothetical protein JXA14_10420 [Anaerolineae bacterium]|nr:hypothetical protein [Anaerolineae bacterium]